MDMVLPRIPSRPKSLVSVNFLLAGLYFLLAQSGLSWGIDTGQVTLVWPPTALALAAFLKWKIRALPGLVAGAFAAGFSTNAPLPFAIVAMVFNPLQAVIAAVLLERMTDVRLLFAKRSSVLAFFSTAVLFAPIVSALAGSLGLSLLMNVPWERFPVNLLTWWVGDAMGVAAFGPLMLSFFHREWWFDSQKAIREFAAWAAVASILCLFIFSEERMVGVTRLSFAFLIFPVLLWAATRFSTSLLALCNALVAMVFIFGTARGLGPFVEPGRYHLNLVGLMWAFLGVSFLTTLFLSALQSENRTYTAEIVAQRKTLEHTFDELRVANETKSRFLASMNHELRTPLNGIIGMTEVLSLTPLDEQQKEYLRCLASLSDDLLGLVNTLLDFSKIEAGHFDFARETFSLGEVIEGAAASIRATIQSKDLRLVVQIDERIPPRLVGYAGCLKTVLKNLLSNAAKFTDQGKITIRFDLAERSHGFLVLQGSVADTGMGIPSAILEQIFVPFFQAGDAPRRAPGTGLGLAISKTFVERMEGNLQVESRPGVGSRFTFRARFEVAEEGTPLSALPEPSP